jgi:hypothetical protein
MNTRFAHFWPWLYYRCYRYSRKGGDSPFTVHWAVAAMQSLLLPSINLIALGFLLFFISPAAAKVFFSAPSWVVGAAFGALIVFQLSLLAYKGRYRKIVKHFSTETVEQQQRGDRLFGWYLVFSVFSFLGLGIAAAVRIGLQS